MARPPARPDERLARHALWQKIELLKDRTPATENAGAGTWDALKAFTGISRETLKAGCPKDEYGVYERQTISSTNEGVLGRKFGFDPSCRTWTHGTVVEFATKFFPKTPDPGAARFIAVRIDEKTGSIDPDERLTVTLFTRSQDGEPGNQPFDAELVCQIFTQVGVRLAVRRGTLRVDCRRELVPPMSLRLAGEDGFAIFERKANTITVTAGGQDHMNWAIETSRPPMGVVSRELVGLFRLSGIRDGDELEISFVVEDCDLVAPDADQTGAAVEAVADDEAAPHDSAIVSPGGAPLGAAKRQLMAHIAKHAMGLFGAQRPNKAVLCRYAIRLVEEKPQGAAEASK
jgi:hypothetical protein